MLSSMMKRRIKSIKALNKSANAEFIINELQIQESEQSRFHNVYKNWVKRYGEDGSVDRLKDGTLKIGRKQWKIEETKQAASEPLTPEQELEMKLAKFKEDQALKHLARQARQTIQSDLNV